MHYSYSFEKGNILFRASISEAVQNLYKECEREDWITFMVDPVTNQEYLRITDEGRKAVKYNEGSEFSYLIENHFLCQLIKEVTKALHLSINRLLVGRFFESKYGKEKYNEKEVIKKLILSHKPGILNFVIMLKTFRPLFIKNWQKWD